mmetsp:Transcript_55047/g.101890  ORF Transcript_55047/g.101890 Transcript_55047/m.101890 type:complete len:122 (-) Transcript_55047:138-503(-)
MGAKQSLSRTGSKKKDGNKAEATKSLSRETGSSDNMSRKESWVDKASPLERQMISQTINAGDKLAATRSGEAPWQSRGPSELDCRTLFDEVPEGINLSGELAKGCTIVSVRGTYIGPPPSP